MHLAIRSLHVLCVATLMSCSALSGYSASTHFWGFAIGQRLDASRFDSLDCHAVASPGDSSYDRRPERIFLRPTHDNHDSTAALDALAHFSVCVGVVPALSSTVVATLAQDTVVRLLFFWRDSTIGPPFRDLRSRLARVYGAPLRADDAVARWRTDSLIIDWLAGPCWMPGGQELHVVSRSTLSRYERIVHGAPQAEPDTVPRLDCAFGKPR